MQHLIVSLFKCTPESVLEDNAQVLALARKHHVNYVLIDDTYDINIDL